MYRTGVHSVLRAAVMIAVVLSGHACSVPSTTGRDEAQVGASERDGSDSLPRPYDEVSVTIRFACPASDQFEFESLAADFHAQNPATEIAVLAIEDILGGNHTDVLRRLLMAADVVYHRVDLEAAPRGWVRDLSPFFEHDATFEPEDFYPGMLEAFEAQGKTWALPGPAKLSLLFFDQRKFDEAGVPYPTLAWTKEDYLLAAKQLTERRGDEFTQFGLVDPLAGARHALVLPLMSGWLDGEPPLDAPLIAGAVQWYTDLALVHEVMPVSSLTEPNTVYDAQDLVFSRRAAMWSYPLDSYEPLRERGWELGVALLPTYDLPAATVFMYGFMMSGGTENPQESWLWLNYLSHQRLLGRMNAKAVRLPARRSLAEQGGYWTQFDEQTTEVLRHAVEHLVVESAGNEKVAQLDTAIDAVFAGMSVELALSEAQTALEAQRYQTAQITPEAFVVSPPQVQGALGPAVIAFALSPRADPTVYHKLADTFNRDHSAVHAQIVTAAQVETSDCFTSDLWPGDADARANLLNLQPLLETDSTFSLDDFYPRFLDAFRYRGDLWGLPTQAQLRIVFYNRNLFDAVGAPYPAGGWTTDDFFARAVALTRGDGAKKQYGFLPLNGDASDLPVLMALRGAALWDQEGRPRFNEPEVVAAVRWYTDLALKHGVMPVFSNDLPDRDPTAQEARYALVRSGRVAMWTDFSGIDRHDIWPTDTEVGMAPLPAGGEGVSEFLYEGLFIAADTSHPEACWEWLRFVSGQLEPVRGLPARLSFLESTAFAGQVGREAVETYRDSLAYADLSRPATLEASSQIRWFYQAVADIWAGARPEIALAEAQREAGK